MENRQWQKLAEKKSRHSQNSHDMYWNIIVYPFNCLSWSILTQRDEKYGYSVIDSRWCVRVLFLFMAYSPPYFSVKGMMILVLAYKMASKVSRYIMAYRKIPFCLWHIDVGLHIFIFLFMTNIRDHSSRPLNRFILFLFLWDQHEYSEKSEINDWFSLIF